MNRALFLLGPKIRVERIRRVFLLYAAGSVLAPMGALSVGWFSRFAARRLFCLVPKLHWERVKKKPPARHAACWNGWHYEGAEAAES